MITTSARVKTRWSCCFVGSALCSARSDATNSSYVRMLSCLSGRSCMRFQRRSSGASSPTRVKAGDARNSLTSAGFLMLLTT